jgi:hypothetical protein
MAPEHGYRFGDLTRGVIRWLGPHARDVYGKINWLKFGKAIVVAMLAGQVVNFGVLGTALGGAIKDPNVAAAAPAAAAGVAAVIELIRRLFQDGRSNVV